MAEDDLYIDSGYYKSKGGDAWGKIDNLSFWLDGFLSVDSVDCLVLEFPSGTKGNMDTNVKLGAALYSCISTFRWWWREGHEGKYTDAPLIIVRPTEVKATGVSKELLKRIVEEGAIQLYYKRFAVPYKKDGTINKAALERLGDELDATGVWLAGLKRMENQDDTNRK